MPLALARLPLSLMAAMASSTATIARLHDFELVLEDADPGVRAIIERRPADVTR
jgi:hypothetical protein